MLSPKSVVEIQLAVFLVIILKIPNLLVKCENYLEKEGDWENE